MRSRGGDGPGSRVTETRHDGRTIARPARLYHRPMTHDATAASLLRSVGLLADGPAVWGRPVPAQGPGVFVIELPEPLAAAPDRADPRREVDRTGRHASGSTASDPCRGRWRPVSERSGSRRRPCSTSAPATPRSPDGSRRSHGPSSATGIRPPAAHWLKTLRSLDGLKIWWAATAATEEYEDALLVAFADGVPETERAVLPDRGVDPAVGEPAAPDRRATKDRTDRVADRRRRRAATPADPS